MDDNTRLVLLAFLAVLTAQLPSLIQGYFNRKASKAQIEEIHTAVNSKMDALIKAASAKAHAEGVIQGAADEQARGKS